jgi:phosphoglycerate dehydrogenase-like enzyme
MPTMTIAVDTKKNSQPHFPAKREKPRVLFAVEEPMFETIFSKRDLNRLGALAHILNWLPPKKADKQFLLNHIDDSEIVVGSWGTSAFEEDVLAKASHLRLVCYGAGTVRPMVNDTFWRKGVRITSAAEAIAYGVAEFCLGLILTAPKRVPWLAEDTRHGYWAQGISSFGGGFEIYQQNIGIIGVGHIGRHLIRLLKNFDCNIHVYDPYLSGEKAALIGVNQVETLDELFSTCRVVSLNAPSIEATRDMLRGHHFAALQKGSVFINTAGSIQIHEAEFVAELRKGHFIACLDRCEQEPCALDHPYRCLPNVLLTPHIAGVMAENRFRIGTFVVDEIENYIHGKPLKFEVTEDALSRMA